MGVSKVKTTQTPPRSAGSPCLRYYSVGLGRWVTPVRGRPRFYSLAVAAGISQRELRTILRSLIDQERRVCVAAEDAEIAELEAEAARNAKEWIRCATCDTKVFHISQKI